MADSEVSPPRNGSTEMAGPLEDAASTSPSADSGAPSYWCYQCRKQVNVEANGAASQEGPSSGIVCVECRSGFVEAVGTPPDATAGGSRRAETGRRRRRRLNARTLSLSDALGQLYPQQVIQVLQLLGQTRVSNGGQEPNSQEQHHEEGPENSASNEDGDHAAAQGRVLIVNEGVAADPEGAQAGDETESETDERVLRAWQSHDEEEDEDEDDEDDWEEVEDGDSVAVGENAEHGEVAGGNAQEADENNGEDNSHRGRIRRDALRRPRNFHRYLQEILQNLVGHNIEVRVEPPEYVGNPGDYVDARGFELILQQLAENDNTRRGAPPASRSAIKRLSSIQIEQGHLDDGSALCAVCKDILCIGELAKQLPCQHLYHEDCILPWLNARNSCPLCRFELPTDDPDYEDLKRSQQQRNRNQGRSDSVPLEHSSSTGAGQEPGQASVVTSSTGTGEVASSSTQYEGEAVMRHPQQELVQRRQQAEVAVNNRRAAARPGRSSSGRGWFLFSAAGPVISVVGLVLVICLGNHFIRSGSTAQVVPRQQVEPSLDQIAGSSETDTQSRRRWWWLPFQR